MVDYTRFDFHSSIIRLTWSTSMFMLCIQFLSDEVCRYLSYFVLRYLKLTVVFRFGFLHLDNEFVKFQHFHKKEKTIFFFPFRSFDAMNSVFGLLASSANELLSRVMCAHISLNAFHQKKKKRAMQLYNEPIFLFHFALFETIHRSFLFSFKIHSRSCIQRANRFRFRIVLILTSSFHYSQCHHHLVDHLAVRTICSNWKWKIKRRWERKKLPNHLNKKSIMELMRQSKSKSKLIKSIIILWRKAIKIRNEGALALDISCGLCDMHTYKHVFIAQNFWQSIRLLTRYWIYYEFNFFFAVQA